MLKFLFGLFLAAHGLVHALYAGHARRAVEIKAGLAWPDDAWLLSGLLHETANRNLAALLCVLATLGFLATALVFSINLSWWRPMLVTALVLSSLTYLIFWDGRLQQLPDQGFIAILLNLALFAVVFLLNWFEVSEQTIVFPGSAGELCVPSAGIPVCST